MTVVGGEVTVLSNNKQYTPSRAVNLVLQQVANLPEDMISHHAAVRANRLKVPKPINGLQVSLSGMLCPGVLVFV